MHSTPSTRFAPVAATLTSLAALLVMAACGGQNASPPTSTPRAVATRDPDESPTPPPGSQPTATVPAGAVELEIGTAPGAKDHRYTVTTLEAPPGVTIVLHFTNNTASKDEIGHNWVLVKPGAEEAVVASGKKAGDNNDWLDVNDQNILAHSTLIEGGQDNTVTFKAPEPGSYTFLSTFPDQFAAGMKGTLIIRAGAVRATAAVADAVVTSAPVVPPGDTPATPDPNAPNFEPFDRAQFDPARSQVVDNAWLPMAPGVEYTYEGKTDDNGKMVPHKLVVIVTDLTKTIDGVTSLVSWDRDFTDGALNEAELAFFAQDKAGTVWSMGEYPEEYENGAFVRAPAWIPGFEDAHAGIAMLARPAIGTPGYAQGWGPAVNWTDRGQVFRTGQKQCTPVKCYDNVLVIAETSKSEPNAYQLKHFAQGVGNIRTDWLGADVSQEILELTSVRQLSAAEMADARAGALALEKHAYATGNSAYAKSNPIMATSAAAPVAEATEPPSSVPPVLIAIEASLEDILDVAPTGDWDAVDVDFASIDVRL